MTVISLDIFGSVELRMADQLHWESNVPSAYKVLITQEGMVIKQIEKGGTTIISSGGNTVISSGRGNSFISSVSGGTVIIGGASGGVWIGGKQVSGPDNGGAPKETPHLIVFVPKGSSVSIKASGSSELSGNAEIGALELKTSGSTEVNLTCHSADLSTSGSSEINLRLRETRGLELIPIC